MNLGGAMVWALDLDDYRNVCGQGHYPLLGTIMKTLGQRHGKNITKYILISMYTQIKRNVLKCKICYMYNHVKGDLN